MTLLNASVYIVHAFPDWFMFTLLNVVNIAVSLSAAGRRSATRLRKRVIGTHVFNTLADSHA